MAILEATLKANGLIVAFAVVGIAVWISYLLSERLTSGRVHGSAIAIIIGLLLAYVVGRFTGGENGIQSVPRGTLLGLVDLSSNANLYIVMAVVVLATLVLYNRIVHSPFGQVLRAIRNNPERAKSLGYDVDRFKIASFIISAALSGLLSSTFASRLCTSPRVSIPLSVAGGAP